MRRSVVLLALLSSAAFVACAERGAGSDERLGTIRGMVLLGPTCPVETIASPCPDRPLAGVSVRAVDVEGDVAASAVSGVDGRYEMDVAAGSYTLVAVTEDDPARSAKPIAVEVLPGETVDMDVLVDSGIR